MFEIYTVTGVNASGVDFNEEGRYDYITRTSLNRGIHSHIDEVEGKIIQPEGTYSLGLLGMDFFYRDEEWFAGQFVRGVRYKDVSKSNNHLISLYLEVVISKYKEVMKAYLVKNIDELFRGIEIELPILTPEDTTPYWDYMAYFIHNIQQQYADQLESKSEYELDLMCQLLGVTREDIKERVPYIEPKYTNKFTVGELFVINRGDISNQGNLVETGVKEGVAFIAQNDSNNGYVKQVEPESYKVYQGRNIVIGRQTGAVYYQDEEFVTTDGVLVLSSTHIQDKEIGWYLVTIIKKHLGHSGYNNTVSATKLNKIELELPVLAPNSKQIDWGAIRHAGVGGGSTIWLLVKRYATEILR